MNISGYLKRFLGMAAVSALCLLPVRLCYGRLDPSQVPDALARLAVPAHRYELETAVFRYPGQPTMESCVLTCYDPWDHPIRTITDEGVYTQRTYNLRGQLLQALTTSGSALTDSPRMCITYAYSLSGRMRAKDQDFGFSRTHIDYVWNADGTGTATAVTESDYDNSRSVERQTLDPDGNILTAEYQSAATIQHQICTYDSYGSLIRQTVQLMDHQIVEEFQYTYDPNGNPLTCHSFIDNAAESATTYTYSNGRLASAQMQYTDGRSTERAYTDVTL